LYIHVTPENWGIFNGRMFMVERLGYRERAFLPIKSFRELQVRESTICIDRLSWEEWRILGDHALIGVFYYDGRREENPSFLPFSKFCEEHNLSSLIRR